MNIADSVLPKDLVCNDFQFPHLVTTAFPGKKTFNNMSTAFLEQRKTQLNMYLQSLLQPSVLNYKENADMAKLVEQFLEPGRYEHTIKKSEAEFSESIFPGNIRCSCCPNADVIFLHVFDADFVSTAKRGMGAIVNPLKSSVKTVGSMVKNVPENIFDGLKDGLVRVLRSKPSEHLEENSKVGAGIDVDVDDNIPFRILLLLMDEVFDLKTRNTWLR